MLGEAGLATGGGAGDAVLGEAGLAKGGAAESGGGLVVVLHAEASININSRK